jgi:hypothetical protein
LLERYLSAAGKISRAAVGDTTLPASYRTYTVPHGLAQTDRMNESMPLGSRGGTSVRHLFPVDGEYEISVGLQSGRYDELLGFERERTLDLRLDNKRLERFTIPADPRAGRDDEALDAFFEAVSATTTGEITLRLYKGNLEPVSRKSPYSLYSLDIASFTMGASYDQKDARGFINLIGLPIQVRASLEAKKAGNKAGQPAAHA